MANVRLSWSANPAAELVSQYQVWEGKDGAALLLRGSTPNTTMDITDLPVGQYRWAIKAVNIAGVSPLSAETVGPGVPSTPAAPIVEVLP